MNKFNSILLSFFFTIIGCKENISNTDSNQNLQSLTMQNKKVEYGQKFFDFDEVDYYSIEISEEDAMKLMDENSTRLSQQKSDIILNDEFPKTIADIDFIKDFNKFGFKKYQIAPANFEDLNKIFVEKTEQDRIDFACIPIFRDILVFKKDNKNIGFAKICFDCHQYHIVGSIVNTENFGQGDDFEKLDSILNRNHHQIKK